MFVALQLLVYVGHSALASSAPLESIGFLNKLPFHVGYILSKKVQLSLMTIIY